MLLLVFLVPRLAHRHRKQQHGPVRLFQSRQDARPRTARDTVEAVVSLWGV